MPSSRSWYAYTLAQSYKTCHIFTGAQTALPSVLQTRAGTGTGTQTELQERAPKQWNMTKLSIESYIHCGKWQLNIATCASPVKIPAQGGCHNNRRSSPHYRSQDGTCSRLTTAKQHTRIMTPMSCGRRNRHTFWHTRYHQVHSCLCATMTVSTVFPKVRERSICTERRFASTNGATKNRLEYRDGIDRPFRKVCSNRYRRRTYSMCKQNGECKWSLLQTMHTLRC